MWTQLMAKATWAWCVVAGPWKGKCMNASFIYSPPQTMLISKFCVSFKPTNLGGAMPRTQELVLDLGLTSGATNVSIEPEATMEACLAAKRPDTAGDACAMMGGSLCLEHTDTTPDTVPDQDSATSTRWGSFNSDWTNGYGLKWLNIDDFDEWHWSEECVHTIELRVAKVEHGTAMLGRSLWTTKHVYKCTHQWVGQRAGQKAHPEQQCKILRKGTGCRCQIVIKCYPHTPIVLGWYVMEHNHDLEAGNLTYTHLSDGTWQ